MRRTTQTSRAKAGGAPAPRKQVRGQVAGEADGVTGVFPNGAKAHTFQLGE